MDPKFDRNKKQVLKRGKVGPDKDNNTSFLINIAQEHDNNTFELLQNI